MLKFTDMGLEPIEALGMAVKISAVEELFHWARQQPQVEMDELQGWNGAKSRILHIAENAETPDIAAEQIRSIIRIVPGPRNARDRGRLKAFNEALDVLTQSDYTGTEMAIDGPPRAPVDQPSGIDADPYGNPSAQNTPQSPSKPPMDGGPGTLRMSVLASNPIPSAGVKYNYESGKHEPMYYDGPIPGVHNKFLITPEGDKYFWEIGPDLRPPHMNAAKQLSSRIPGFDVAHAGEWAPFDVNGVKGSAGYPVFHTIFEPDEEELESIRRAFPEYDEVVNYNQWLPLRERVTAAEETIDPPTPDNEIPTFNARGLYDLRKFVGLRGNQISWEEFMASSSAPDEDLKILLEIITELGIARSTDNDPERGSFEIDREALEKVLRGRDSKTSVDNRAIRHHQSQNIKFILSKIVAFCKMGNVSLTPSSGLDLDPITDSIFESNKIATRLGIHGPEDFISLAEEIGSSHEFGDSPINSSISSSLKFSMINSTLSSVPFLLARFGAENVLNALGSKDSLTKFTQLIHDYIIAYIESNSEGLEKVLRGKTPEAPSQAVSEPHKRSESKLAARGKYPELEHNDILIEQVDWGVFVHQNDEQIKGFDDEYDGVDDSEESFLQQAIKWVKNNLEDLEAQRIFVSLDESGRIDEEITEAIKTDQDQIKLDGLKMKLAQADHDGVMVALIPPKEVSEKLALDDGEPAEDLHITLAYLGKADEFDEDEVAEALEKWIEGRVPDSFELPIKGRISGYGTFKNDDGYVLWASADIPHIDDVRHYLADLLEGKTPEDDPLVEDLDEKHGFTPHMTLKYSDEPFETLPELPELDEVEFDLALVFDENRTDLEEKISSVLHGNQVISMEKLLKFASREQVERKAQEIFDSGGVDFVTATPSHDSGRTAWEFDVHSTSGEVYPVYGDTYIDQPEKWIDWRDVACSCPWGRWNYDRAPAYKHLESYMCSHALASEKWLVQNGKRENDRVIREQQTGQPELQFQEPTVGPRRPRPGEQFIREKGLEQGIPQTQVQVPQPLPVRPMGVPPGQQQPVGPAQQPVRPQNMGPTQIPQQPVTMQPQMIEEEPEAPRPVRPVFRNQVLRPRGSWRVVERGKDLEGEWIDYELI